MSSFSNPHYMYLFEMNNGKKKLAYGQSPEDALSILAMRLSAEEMAQIQREQYIKIKQRELQQYVPELGKFLFENYRQVKAPWAMSKGRCNREI
jgi:hypothetical protein